MTRGILSRLVLLIGLLLVAGGSLGCASSMVPFTYGLRREHGLTDDDVKQLQFYVSRGVTLRRDAYRNKRQIERGRLKLFRGKQVEQVVLRDATPGVATAVSADTITVSFAEGSALTFSLRGTTTVVAQPLRIKKTRFALAPAVGSTGAERGAAASSLGAYYLHTSDDGGLVPFQGAMWTLEPPSDSVHLMIDAQTLEEVVETRQVLEGRRLSLLRSRQAVPLMVF